MTLQQLSPPITALELQGIPSLPQLDSVAQRSELVHVAAQHARSVGHEGPAHEQSLRRRPWSRFSSRQSGKEDVRKMASHSRLRSEKRPSAEQLLLFVI